MVKISRRHLIASGLAGTVVAACSDHRTQNLKPDTSTTIPLPSKAQRTWQEAELGVVFHYDLHVFDGHRYIQSDNRQNPISNIDIFAPDAYDIDQWFEAVKGMGAKYALITATHETGFALWPSKANPWNISKLKWRDGKANIVKDFVDACRRHDILPGIYLGVRWNSHLRVLDFKVTNDSPLSQQDYNEMVKGMVTEICRDFGPLAKIWFDGGILAPDKGGADVLPIFEKHQPDCLFYHSTQRADARWAGTEDGRVADPCWHTADVNLLYSNNDGNAQTYFNRSGDADGPDWCPAMADAPLRGTNGRHEWFWEPNDEENLHSLNALTDMYFKSVGRGGTLVIGLTPNPHGRIPDADVARCQEWGNAIRKAFSQPLGAMSDKGKDHTLSLSGPGRVKHVIIQEDITKGQRVRRWHIDALGDDGRWRSAAEGTAIGHKRIVTFGTALPTKKIRLRITDDVAEPVIRNFAAFAGKDEY